MIKVYNMEGKLIDTCEDWIEFDDCYGGSDEITWEEQSDEILRSPSKDKGY